MYEEWKGLKKSKGKKLGFSLQKENTWKEKLHELFDIAHADHGELVTIAEDKEFVRLQRQGRKGKL